MTRSETLIITAALALAILPKFETGVEQYVKNHKTEIAAVLHPNGPSPALPRAAPRALAMLPLAFDPGRMGLDNAEMNVDRVALQVNKAQMRLEMVRLQPMIALARAQARLARKHVVVLALPGAKCPAVPAVGALPAVSEISLVSSGS